MKIRHLLCAAAACIAFSLPAAAQSKDAFDAFDAINPEVLFKGLIREDDLSLLFQHLRESMAASARGEEALPSEAMQRRTDQIQREAAARGSVLLSVLLTAFESAARQAVREGLGEFSSRRKSRNSVFPPHTNPYD